SIPVLQRDDTGDFITAQFDMRDTWSDGSLRWCECSFFTTSLPAHSSADVHVFAQVGSFNNTSVFTDTTIAGASDIKVALTNLTDYLGNTYATGSTEIGFNSARSVNLEHIKSGPVCDQYKAWAFFPNQGGGASDQLAYFGYVTGWNDPANPGSIL